MIIRLTHPLISCICVTAYRPEFLLKAIINFDTQKYPNRELVISYPKDDLETKELVEKILQLSELNIILVSRHSYLSIGEARNQAVAKSNGDYICTWDDDDWYSERRLADQYNSTLTFKQKREASILTNVVLYDRVNDNAYISREYNWAGSLLCKKDIIVQHPYLDTDVAEDTALLNYLISSKYLNYIAGRGDLYTFIYHGTNILSRYEFAYFVKKGQLLNQESKDWIAHFINQRVEISLP